MPTPHSNPSAEIVTQLDVHQEFALWETTVRDFAKYHSEGPRRIVIGNVICEYEISPLADGRYALRSSLNSDNCYRGAPWDAYPSREEALRQFIAMATRAFEHDIGRSDVKKSGKVNLSKMLSRLGSESLFGFEEPEPLPRSEWWDEMIGDQIGRISSSFSARALDLLRGMKLAPSKTGSFFDIPLPKAWGKGKGRFQGVGDPNIDADDPTEDDDEEDESYDALS